MFGPDGLGEPKPSERNPLFCRICHAPRQVSEETGDVTGCGQRIRNIALPVPPLAKAGAYRRSSPSSLWEAVKKYHYTRAVSSRPACHGRVNRMRGSLWRCRRRAALFAAPPHGGCTRNIVYSTFKVRWRKQCPFNNQDIFIPEVRSVAKFFQKAFNFQQSAANAFSNALLAYTLRFGKLCFAHV